MTKYAVTSSKVVYSDPSKKTIEVSLPHILKISAYIPAILGPPIVGPGPMPAPPVVTPAGVIQDIYLFNAAVNLMASNFGNANNVSVTYINYNPAVPFYYSSLLATIEGAGPFVTAVTRIQTITQTQANRVLSITRNPGVGKVEAFNILPRTYPDQFQPNIVHLEKEYTIDKFTGLTFKLNITTDPTIYMYFYNNKSIELARAFSNRNVLQDYLGPQNGMVIPVIPVYSSKAMPVRRSDSLL